MKRPRDLYNIVAGDYTLGQKFNYLNYFLSKKDSVLKYMPTTISIVATSRCTLSCSMCPTHSGTVPKSYPYRQDTANDMSLSTFKEIIDRFNNAINVQIIGSGEPLLNRDFFAMANYASSKKMIVKTFSNGTTISDNIDKLLDSRLDGITISLNGHNAEEFNRMTGSGRLKYESIYNTVEMLIRERQKRKSSLKVKLSFIMDKQNLHNMQDMINVGLELGADHLFLCNFLSSPYPGLTADERALYNDESTANHIRTTMDKLPILIRKKITTPPLLDKTIVKNGCDAHFSQIRFDGDGNVSSCSMMLLNMSGNGNYKDPDVWNSGFFKSMRAKFASNNKADLPGPCCVCPDNIGV